MSSYAQKQVPGGHLSPRMTRLVGMTADQMRAHLGRMTAAELDAHRTDFLATIRVYDTQVMYQRGKAVNPLPLSRDMAEAGLDIVQIHLPGAQAREEEAREHAEAMAAADRKRKLADAIEAARAIAQKAAIAEHQREERFRDLDAEIERSLIGAIYEQDDTRRRAATDFIRVLASLDPEGQQALLDSLGDSGDAVRRALVMIADNHPAALRPDSLKRAPLKNRQFISDVLYSLGALLHRAR